MGTTTTKGALCAVMTWALCMMHFPLAYAQIRSDEDLIRDAIRIFRDRFNVKDFASLSGEREPPRILRPVHAPGSGRRSILSFPPALEPASPPDIPADFDTTGRTGTDQPDTLISTPASPAHDTAMARQDSLLRFDTAGSVAETAGKKQKVYPPAVLASGRPVKQRYFRDLTTSGQEYSSSERKVLKGQWIALFEEIPPEVQIAFREEGIHIEGNTATVTARYVFERRSLTPESERFAGMEGFVTFHLRKEAETWKIRRVGELLNTMKNAFAH